MPFKFSDFSRHAACWLGTSWAFLAALLVVIVWIASGPVFGYSDTWQLVINTGTTIVTFLMVFLIQNTQNRDSHAVQLKLDELIRALEGPRNEFVGIEHLTQDELERIKATLERECDSGTHEPVERLLERL